eukprot:3783785-Prymnesium_polylepis.1
MSPERAVSSADLAVAPARCGLRRLSLERRVSTKRPASDAGGDNKPRAPRVSASPPLPLPSRCGVCGRLPSGSSPAHADLSDRVTF